MQRSRWMGKGVILRAMVDNVAGKRYWSTVGPANISGSNKDNPTAHLGAPRTASVSLGVDL
ncbi:hypothetical protein [Massilia sp. 9096]|uniref:hypothetical protein n=1 Tax=Massilia sp. 9096 TaxID=1500894 RepID=UPI001EFA2CBB|nr:hypothetical protein [Massilia sp. 9096]